MKALRSVEFLTTPRFVVITAFGILFFTFFYIGTFWSDFDRSNPLPFFFTVLQSPLSPSVVDLSANSNVTLSDTSFFLVSNQTTNVSVISVPVLHSAAPPPSPSPLPFVVDLSANSNVTLSDTSSSLVSNQTTNVSAISIPILPSAAPPPPLAVAVVANPPPPDRLGIVDENGAMRDDFIVGEFDPDLPETPEKPRERVYSGGMVKMEKFRMCPLSMKDIIPCLDNLEEIRKLNLTEKGEKFERHCPREGKSLNCLVPAPKGYKAPIPWPKSRDQVWYRNIPHPHLAEDQGGQNWISIEKDKFKFSGGGTQYIHGVDKYLNQISQMVRDIAFGNRTTVVLDVGCGVASFGAFLLSQNVTTLSIAPKDVHDNQIQFALERGVPAMVAAFTTKRLSYPSQAFDMIHCSWCQINWTRDDGILLLEVNRMLRAGGYFAWAAEPVYKHEESQQEAWKGGNAEKCIGGWLLENQPSRLTAELIVINSEIVGVLVETSLSEMENLTTRICWELIKKEGYIAIWQKPLDNNCYLSHAAGFVPPLCETDDDPDNVWYVDLKACITRLPDNGYGAGITNWPARLHHPPDRLQSVKMDAYTSKDELFMAESKDWNDIVRSYVKSYHWKQINMRNVMDMRAGFGGFAAALVDLQLNAWVMNVVPVCGPNTLPVIYDRGLIGVMHDWCEPFDTYPRTYDLLHASSLFSMEKRRCNISKIMLEMNRMLRPGGHAYIRDTTSIIEEVQKIAMAMGWRTSIRNPSEGPYTSRRILNCDKKLRRS